MPEKNPIVEQTIVGEAAMVVFGQRLGAALPRGGIVFFSGALGAGKTTLCRGVLEALGNNGAVKSPTYTLVEPYALNGRTVYHFDLYRLADPEELEYIGVRDYFEAENLCLVEWPERGSGHLPEPDLSIQVSVFDEARRLVCEAGSSYGLEIINMLRASSGE